MEKRPIIGLLANDLEGSYQFGHWIGLEEIARENNCHLVSFNGGDYDSPWLNKKMANAAFDLATSSDVDALILIAPVVANTLTSQQTLEFVQKFSPIPFVSSGLEIPGIPSVLLDNGKGMEEVVEHVVGYHGRRRPVYLGGPEQNPEAIERRSAFLNVLNRHHLALDPKLDLVCEFDFRMGQVRVGELIENGIEFDAIISANDNMALGAMEALKEYGKRVPEDVIVTGFDDSEDAMFSTPALTSVHQPVTEQGKLSMSLILDLLAGKPVPMVTHGAATLVARGSCGCHSKSIAEGRFESPDEKSSFDFGSSQSLDSIKTEIDALEWPVVNSVEFADFFEHFSKESTNPTKGAALVGFEKLLQAHSRETDDADRWQLFISQLRNASSAFIPPEKEKAAEFEALFHQFRLVSHERAVQQAAYRSLRIERWTRQLHETGSRLITTFEVSHLIETLARDLPNLQLNTCHILLREKNQDMDQIRLILSYNHGIRYELPPGGKIFPINGIVRDLVNSANHRAILAIEPLFFESTPLGFVIVELASRRGMLLDALRNQISAALMGARLANEVSSRTRELEAALITLEKNQKQLVHSEKMASLGKLTAGIAHEMNTPLSAMRSSLEEMRRLVLEYSESIGDRDVGPEDHQEIASEMTKAVEIAVRAGEKASGFVRSIKSQTRDMGVKDKQIFDCVRVVEESILLLSHALRFSKCAVRFDIRSRPCTILGIPDRLSQVVTNLVTNAMDAMESNGQGAITVGIDTADQETRIWVADTGCGIPEENLSRIFDPLFTTKPVGKGTGLGLTIINDIVQGDFGGRIDVESSPTGTTFTVRLPEVKEA